ncbi:hypothetical protein LSH36_1011g00039 [Paralvinella palmiformis]|uniref:Uncharacterized protein n=1 Tax=Paralvinella palmiformis TaxID=53620 RepID=A0AAD9IWI5_9ANNE|nr:hypothetical protein LSH36_1011g00039 [Paralvinella palmiformis]
MRRFRDPNSNCDDAMVGCILNNKEIMDSIFSSNHTTGTLDEDPPNTVTENPNKYNPDMKTANDVTLSSRDTSNRVTSTFTNHEKLSPLPSSRITRDIRSTVTISSLTSARSGTDGSDVTQPQTEQLTSHYRNTMTELSTRMTSSSTEPMESNSSLTTSITTQIDRSFINGGQTSSASHVSSALWVVDESSTSEIDVIPETGQSADRPRTASFVTVKDVDVGTSFKTKQQQQQTPAVHSIVCDSATSSQESGTPRDSSSEFLDSSSSSLANAKTSIPELYTTTNGLYQSTSAPDDVISRALTGITPLHGILPTTTTTYSNVYVPDFVRIIDNTSPPNKTFWITVILIVSVDSILLVAIAVLGIVIFKRKQLEESDEKCSGQDDGESVSSECKYYHFNFEVLQNEATV